MRSIRTTGAMRKSAFGLATAALLTVSAPCAAQGQPREFGRADTLRGSITEERAWWDAVHYDIRVEPDYGAMSLSGTVRLRFRVLTPSIRMQIDLQEPMQIDQVEWGGRPLTHIREGNAWLILFPEPPAAGSLQTIIVTFSGKPLVAKRPPWDGGWIFTRDRRGRPWMSVACQGLGASVWYPCKDHQSDEPDSAAISITVPDTLVAVANGRLRSVTPQQGGRSTYTWAVTSPINLYNIVPYIGKYVSWGEVHPGEAGPLTCTYHVLDYELDRAKAQFTQVSGMLSCFEHWFGPYPFYADGYQLVQAPHLGMEHQSAVAYGNDFKNGYRGNDLSASGWGLKWDFIIVHESGHEWFGNNISSKDMADKWVHESFTNYSETVFTGCQSGTKAASEYVAGTRRLIRNDIPVVGRYGVNDEGSGDMYYKGGNMIHYMRQLFRDDERFRRALRAMNDTFRHATVTYGEVVGFWSRRCGIDLSKLFEQYLKTTKIPVLAYRTTGDQLQYRWKDAIDGYDIPVKVMLDGKTEKWLYPSTQWKTVRLAGRPRELLMHPDFYAGISRE
jgi:aminopeptidase N